MKLLPEVLWWVSLRFTYLPLRLMAASFKPLLALNTGAHFAGTFISSPVWGLRAIRAFLFAAEKVPRPEIFIPSWRFSWMVSMKASTIPAVSDFVESIFLASASTNSALFNSNPPNSVLYL